MFDASSGQRVSAPWDRIRVHQDYRYVAPHLPRENVVVGGTVPNAVHLPRLAEAGFVAYDPETCSVTPTRCPSHSTSE
jgi:hypothetical protein